MSLNWKEIELILSELPLEGSHIQGIRQPDFRSLVLELYRPGEAFNLYINLGTSGCRLHRLTRKIEYPRKTQRFAEFLRSRVRGGRIIEAGQIPGDRIVKLCVRRGDETTILWIRLWGAASNVIAVEEDGTVLDAYFRRPGKGEETGGRYAPEESLPPAGKSSTGENPEKVYSVRAHPEDILFNAFIDGEYRLREEADLRVRLLARLESGFKSREARLCSTLAGLRKRQAEYAGVDGYRKFGDLIMANLHAIRKGDPWCRAADFESGEEIEISLDETLSPYENAEAYFQKYKKARSGMGILDEEILNLEMTLRRLEIRYDELRAMEDLGALEAALRGDGRAQGKVKEKNAPPGLQFESNGFRILVGRTSAENDELLRRHVRGNDYWLHTRDCPGGYVFIKSISGKSVPLETLLDAGNLAVFYSKARSSGAAELYYTQAKHLRRAKGEKPGTVLPSHEKNLSVKLDPLRLDRLQGNGP